MAQWQIHNMIGGTDLGTYEGATRKDALDAMARDAGYRDQDHAEQVTGTSASDLLVTKIDDAAEASFES